MLSQVYAFYSRSPKRYRELQKVGELASINVIKFKRIDGTRWIGHRKDAMEALSHNYGLLLQHWADATNYARKDVPDADKSKMKNWMKRLSSYKFFHHLHLYLDIVSDIASVSYVFQEADISLAVVNETVDQALDNINDSINVDGPWLSKAKEDLVISDDTGEVEYEGNTIHGFDEDAVRGEKEKVLEAVQRCLTSRLSDFTNNPLLSKALILDPSNWPDDNEELKTYGDENVTFLLSHFQQVLEPNGCVLPKAKREWKLLKAHITKNHPNVPYAKLWPLIFRRKVEMFSNILHLVAIIQVYPISNAQLERAFSALKRVFTDSRACLSTPTINDLMTIVMDGPEVTEFDSVSSVKAWLLEVGQHGYWRLVVSDQTRVAPQLTKTKPAMKLKLKVWLKW